MQFPAPIDHFLQRILPAWVDRKVLAKVVSFGLIGCVNAVIHIAVFSACYYFFGLPVIVANPIAWCVAVTNSYVMNALITFAAESGRRLSLKAHFAFAATQFAGLVANTATIYIVAGLIPASFTKLVGIDPILIALIVAIGVGFVVDFTLSHLVVFRRREQAAPQDQQEDLRGTQRQP
jgi:putative flippase GtrA